MSCCQPVTNPSLSRHQVVTFWGYVPYIQMFTLYKATLFVVKSSTGKVQNHHFAVFFALKQMAF